MGIKFNIGGVEVVADTAQEAANMIEAMNKVIDDRPKKLRRYKGLALADMVTQVFKDWQKTNPGKGLAIDRVVYNITRDHEESFVGDVNLSSVKQIIYQLHKAGVICRVGRGMYIAA